MRKSTIFISVALTTVMLVMLFGVVSAYQSPLNPFANLTRPEAASQQQQTSVQQQPTSAVEPVATPTAMTPLTPEQAAQLAAQMLGRTDLYSVEVSSWNGAPAFLVTFSSGDLAYISPEGLILNVSKLQPTVVTNFIPSTNKKKGGNGGSNSSGGGGSEHEGGDD